MKKLVLLFGVLLFVFTNCKKEDLSPADDDNGDGNGNGTTEEVSLKGHWLAVFEDAFEGPGDVLCNAIYMDIADSNYLIYSFLDGEPSSGSKGTYEYNNVDSFAMQIELIADSGTYEWTDISMDSIEAGMLFSLSSDEQTLYATTPAGEITFKKVSLSVPLELVETWEIPDYANMQINQSGEFTWNATDGGQSGTLQATSVVDGNTYLLYHITFCTYYTEGESDYYGMSRYEIAGDSLTLWNGEDEMVLTIQQ